MRMATLAAVAALFSTGSSLSWAQSVQVRDANGALVGLYLDSVSAGATPAFRVLTSTNHVANIDASTGRVVEQRPNLGFTAAGFSSSLAFTSSNCTGQAYVITQPVAPASGFVIDVGENAYVLYFAPRGEQPTVRSFSSTGRVGGSCAQGPGMGTTLRVFPNDPSVTGLPNTPFAPPLSLSAAATPWLLFKDGFETQAG